MDEAALIVAAQKGDKPAFQELIQFYYPYVMRFLHKTVQDHGTCEDLTQETFLKLIRTIDRYDLYGKATFSTYVMTIAHHTCIDYWRKNRRPIANITDYEDLADRECMELAVEKSFDSEIAIALLDFLSPEQAAVIRMKYLEQRSLEEISKQLELQPKTIKSRIHNGIIKLRRSMNVGGIGNG